MPKDPNRIVRPELIKVRCTSAERSEWNEKAKAAGVTISVWIRHALNNPPYAFLTEGMKYDASPGAIMYRRMEAKVVGEMHGLSFGPITGQKAQEYAAKIEKMASAALGTFSKAEPQKLSISTALKPKAKKPFVCRLKSK